VLVREHRDPQSSESGQEFVMLTRLLWRPVRPARPSRVYYLLGGATSFLLVLAFTLNQVYYVTVVGLSPLQMVLVGTVVEATCFVFEIPTGIVADLYSRRLSVVLGVTLMGAGMLLQGLVPTFAAVLVAQVVWGTGSTFLSGADQAWLADEIGEDAVGPVFTRETQIALALTLAAPLAAGALGLVGLGLPLAVSGGGLLALAVVLLFVMPEENFQRTPSAERETFRHLVGQARDGVRVARVRPVVRTIALVSLVAGLASEAFDRLWTVRVLESFTLPDVAGLDGEVVWFTGIALAGTLVSLVVSLLVNRLAPRLVGAEHPNRLLAALVGLQVVFVMAVALGGALWLVLAALWGRSAAGALAAPIRSAWLNRNLSSRTRATVISMTSQLDAVGQVLGGPPLGALANRTSTSTALVASAVILTPAVVLYARSRPGPASGGEDDGERGVAGFADERDRPAMGGGDGRDDGQPQAGAPGDPVT
jgi:DHA3 family tetracycline resistance protein-like MFS transporter